MSEWSRANQYVRETVRAEATSAHAVVTLARQQNLTLMAAGVAYYAFVSVIPLVLLTVVVASVLGGDVLADQVIGLVGQQLSASGQEVVTSLLTDSTGRASATVVGLLVLVWGSMRLLHALSQGIEGMYPNVPRSSLPEAIRDAFVAGLGLVVTVALVVAVTVVLSVPSLVVPFVEVVGVVLTVCVLALALFPIYYVLPPVDVSARSVLPGALAAAIGLVVLQTGFGLFVAHAGQYGAYGVIGAVLLFVTWLYFTSTVVLLGAAVNAVRQDG